MGPERIRSLSLLVELQPHFTPAQRQRGRELFLMRRVDLGGPTEGGWFGTVRDKRSLDVEVFLGAGHAGACDCPTSQDYAPCEHQWALVLEGGMLESAIERFGQDRQRFRFRRDAVCGWRNLEARKEWLPAFLARVTELEDEWREAEAGPAGEGPLALEGNAPAARRDPRSVLLEQLEHIITGGAAARQREEDQPEWKRRLGGAARPQGPRPLLWPEGSADPVEIAWLLDPEPDADGTVRLSATFRRRGKTGRMGPWRWLEGIEKEARQLSSPHYEVLLSLSQMQNRFGWSWRHPWGTFEVPVAAASSLLGAILPTGRVFLWRRMVSPRPPKELPQPLRYDERPIRVVVRHRRDAAGKRAVVDCELRRGDELLDPAAIEAGLPTHLVAGSVASPLESPAAWSIAEATDFGRDPLTAPIAEEHALLHSITEVLHDCSWESEVYPERTPTPSPLLRIRAPARPKAQMQEAELLYELDSVTINGADPRSLVFDGKAMLRRDEAAEERLLRQLLDAGCVPPAEPTVETLVLVPRARLLDVVLPLLNQGWGVEVEGLKIRSAGETSIRVASGVDWFDVHGVTRFEGIAVPVPQLLRQARSGDRFVRLDDGSLGVLPEDWLRRWQGLLALADEKSPGEALRVRSSQAWTIDLLLAESEAEAVDLDKTFAERREKLAAFQAVEPAEPPAGFRGSLRHYQQEGLGWLRFLQEFGFGGCLADDMGLGKTVQVLAMLLARKPAASGRPTLVVAPRSLVFHWQEEAARFTPDLKVLDFTGSGRWQDREPGADAFAGADLVVTSYGTLRRDIEHLEPVRFDYVILDEAQAIKNARSQVSKAARVLRAEHRLALSGTPVENHLDELWALFEFLNPGMLGRARVFKDLVSGKGATSGADLRRVLRPFLLRRTKEVVLTELPAKSEQILRCDLEGAQARAYEELRQRYRAELLGKVDPDDLQEARFEILTALLRLRQAACHPALIDKRRGREGSAKLDALLPMLEEVVESGHRALVFSQFTSFLAIVRQRLQKAGIDHAYLDGQTRDRKQQVARFQEGECPVFLISLKAGGFGLNLTAADYVFLLDPWWNPAVERQAIDRAHRIGQTRKVLAYRLIARGTIEEKVLELQDRKRELAESLFADESGGGLRDLTREDLELLLSR